MVYSDGQRVVGQRQSHALLETVLNPVLYQRLVELFGSVKVANAGQSATPFSGGEQYRVCCPYCNDKRHRLYISHLYATSEHRGLAYCHNETHCLDRPDNRDDLYERIVSGALFAVSKPTVKSAAVQPRAVHASWPGSCIALTSLPDKHIALQFLSKRGFDARDVGFRYRLHYCVYGVWRPAQDRLIIPIYEEGRMIGWQARALRGEKPKYYSCPSMPRNRILYGLDEAKSQPYVVVVESPLDVWAVGPAAVAILGSQMTGIQQQRLTAATRGKPILLALDADVPPHQVEQLASRLACLQRARVYVLRWPAEEAISPSGLSPQRRQELIQKALA